MKQLASFASIATAVLLIMSLGHAIQAQETEVEIRRGEVLRVVGNTLLIRVEGEGVKRYTIPSDFRFNHQGGEITVRELREGMILTGVRLRTTGVADVEDIETAMAEIAEVPAESAEDSDAETEAAEAESEEGESAEAPAATAEAEAPETEAAEAAEAVEAAEAAETTTEEAAASSEEAVGMSPALMVGLVLLVLVLIVFAVKGLGGKKARR